MIAEQAKRLDSFLQAIADGKVTDEEVKDAGRAACEVDEGNRAAARSDSCTTKVTATAVRTDGLRHDAVVQHDATVAAEDRSFDG